MRARDHLTVDVPTFPCCSRSLETVRQSGAWITRLAKRCADPSHRFQNLTKAYEDIPLGEAPDRAEHKGRDKLAPITQGQYLATSREILDLALEKRFISIDPAVRVKPLRRDKLSLQDRRQSFTDKQLTAFFQSDSYRNCAASGQRHIATTLTVGGGSRAVPVCVATG